MVQFILYLEMNIGERNISLVSEFKAILRLKQFYYWCSGKDLWNINQVQSKITKTKTEEINFILFVYYNLFKRILRGLISIIVYFIHYFLPIFM